MDIKEEMNEQKDRKTDKKKRLCLSILVLIMLLFVPLSAYASEIKSDGKTTQVIEEENKTVRGEAQLEVVILRVRGDAQRRHENRCDEALLVGGGILAGVV